MAGWLQKILPSSPPVAKKTKVPAVRQKTEVAVPGAPITSAQNPLPTASVIYGVAASGLFVIAVYFLLTGRWFTGGLVLLPATCFLGFALHFLKVG